MKRTIHGKTNKQIAKDTKLEEAEISMALNCKRLLGREKLRKIVDAGYSIYPFIFGRTYLQDNNSIKKSNTSRVQEDDNGNT